MPRRYRPASDDYFVFTAATTLFSAFKPIEDKLKAGGYKGLTFADFDNTIYKAMGVVDEEATRQKQEKENEKAQKKGKVAPKVNPVYKTSDEDYLTNMGEVTYAEKGNMYLENNINMRKTISKESEKRFRELIKKYDEYLALIEKNTPKDEYEEELKELKFHRAYIRMIKVMGSRELLEDQLGFGINYRAFDGDHSKIKVIEGLGSGATREVWRNVMGNYPLGNHRDSFEKLVNTVCDYEENKEKDTYIEQIKYRENYKNVLKNYLKNAKALEYGEGNYQKLAETDFREEVISELKEKDGPNKNIDYHGILKRVEEQEKAGEEPDILEKGIVNVIREGVKAKMEATNSKALRNPYNSRYNIESEAMGFSLNGDEDFTGKRGNSTMFHEVEAQLDAIEMGWPMDELIHIQRLLLPKRTNFNQKVREFTLEDRMAIKAADDFYKDRIKGKPYPATEEARQEFYRDFYQVSLGIVKATASENYSNEFDEEVYMEWNEFSDGIKATMEKPLSFAQKLVVDHVQKDSDDFAFEELGHEISSLKANIGKDRFGHGNSKEYDKLKKAFNMFEVAYNSDEFCFERENLSPEHLKILTELKESAEAYLKEKDKDKKLPEERSDMGKARYIGAKDAYHLADKIIKIHEAKALEEAEKIKEAKMLRDREEARKVFLNPNDPKLEHHRMLEAGGKLEYEALKAEESIKKDMADRREPVTDFEKYKRFIENCRLDKDDPVTFEDEGMNREMIQHRIDNLGNMLAAVEFDEAGKPFDSYAITRRGAEIKMIYGLDTLKVATDHLNGPEKLKNALTATFRAVDTLRELEACQYEVEKGSFKNINEAQSKYKKDIEELLNRKKPATLSENSRNILDALNEIKDINTKDKSLVGINAYKMKKANAKLMKAIADSFEGATKIDKDAYGPKLALDSLAVLDTYANCKYVKSKLLLKVNSKSKDMNGNNLNINEVEFNKNYGVKHTKEINRKIAEANAKKPVNANKNRQAAPVNNAGPHIG